VDWMHLAQDRLVAGSCDHGNKPLDYVKCGTVFGNLRDY
jgi:hypothetical protein